MLFASTIFSQFMHTIYILLVITNIFQISPEILLDCNVFLVAMVVAVDAAMP